MMSHERMPAYLKSLDQGELEKRVQLAAHHLENCDVCPLECGVNRLEAELGVCKTGEFARVSSSFAHPGEEGPISGNRGSGTIFFNRCNLRCVYSAKQNTPQLAAWVP